MRDHRGLRDSLVGTSVTGRGGNHYALGRCIGQGGQGWVFRAEGGESKVVVKILRPDAVDSRSIRRFQREAALLREVGERPMERRTIVRFYDHGIARVRDPATGALHSLPFNVLEDVPGTTLAGAMIESKGRGFPVARVRRILSDVASALEVVHAKHVIHRDLKPSNVLLTHDENGELAKVTDFGFARFADISPLTTSLVTTGLTLGYAPPEQYENGNPRVTARTDVFSLAAIVWEMLAGRPAFPVADNETAIQVVARISKQRPSLVRDTAFLPPELVADPRTLRTLDAHLQQALEPEPEARQPSIERLASAIESALIGINS